jgi:hypothetical protein
MGRRFFYRPGQLIGAGGPPVAALYTPQLFQEFPGVHSLHQGGDGLEISVAAILKGYRMDLVIRYGKMNFA